MAMYLCNGGSNSGDLSVKVLFDKGVLNEDDFLFSISESRPACEISGDYIICTESYTSDRNGFKLSPKDSTKKYSIIYIFELASASNNNKVQYGNCDLTADPYICAKTGTGRINYKEYTYNLSGVIMASDYMVNANTALFCDFTKSVKVKSILYTEV